MPPYRKNPDMPQEIYEAFQSSCGYSRLYHAAWKGDFRTVRAMIRSGADVNHRAPAQMATPIFGAIFSEDVQMIEEFIRARADLNAESAVGGATPLIVGISTLSVEIVKLLLDSGANIRTKTYKDNSALHYCADMGNAKIAKLLIDRGLNVNIRNELKATPLHSACKSGKTDIVRLLISEGANVSAIGNHLMETYGVEYLWSNVTPIVVAAEHGHADIVDILIKAGADVNVKTSANSSALHLAAQNGHVKVVNKLLEAGAARCINDRSNFYDCTPLLLAVKTGKTDVVKALLKMKNIEVNPTTLTETTPLVMAAGSNRFEEVKLLLAHGALINGRMRNGMTSLHMALFANRVEIVEYLINRGADVTAADRAKATPLHVACEKNVSVNLINALVAKGANVDAKKVGGITPLHLAAKLDHVEIVKFLVDNGADLNAGDDDNWTALHYATANSNVKTVTYLAKKASNIDAMSRILITPLHIAVQEGLRKVVEIFCAKGVNAEAYKDAKTSPLHIALEKKRLDSAELLLKHDLFLNFKEKKEGCSPLFLAVKNKHTKLVHLLLDKHADVNLSNNLGILPIHVAIKAENLDLVEALLAKGAFYNAEVQSGDYSGTPLDMAQKAGNNKLIIMLELIKKLFSAVIKNDVDKLERCVQAGSMLNARNASGRSALHIAVSNSNSDAVKALLTGDVDITLATSKGDLPLQIAIANGSMNIFEILLAHAKNSGFVKYNSVINANSVKGSGTTLHTAVEKSEVDFFKFLLSSGAVYNAKNGSGKTPLELTVTDEEIKTMLVSTEKLFKAAKKGDGLEEVVRILADESCIVNARDVDGGGTPLYWSVAKGYNDMAHKLLSSGANYCLCTNKGTTPLHIAASKGNAEVVKMLVRRAKDDYADKASDFINAATISGTVALHVASNLEVVCSLLQAGAKYDLRSADGKTAAELTRNDDVRQFLKKTHQIFEDVKKGVYSVLNILDDLEIEEFKAIAKAQNIQGQTLVQMAEGKAPAKMVNQLRKKLSKV